MTRKEKSAAAAFLEAARATAWVEVVLRDGRTLQGAVIFNPIRQTGTIVNAVLETRNDFSLDDIQVVREVVDPRLVNLGSVHPTEKKT